LINRGFTAGAVSSPPAQSGWRRWNVRKFVLQVMVTPDGDGKFLAKVPALPACISCGKTRDEAITNVKEAARQYMETLGVDNFEMIDQSVISEVEVTL